MRRTRLRFGAGFRVASGHRHEIRNTGRGLLRALNAYVPPASTKAGDELPRGRR